MPEAERVPAQSTGLEMALSTKTTRPRLVKPAPLLACEAFVERAEPVVADSPARERASDDPYLADFVRAALAPEDSAIRDLANQLLANGRSVQSIYLDLLAPAARALGDLWGEDSCDFVEVTMAVGRLQLVLRDLSQMFVRDRPEEDVAGRVLLACVPGEQHSLGLFMVAEFFVRDGWEVHVGPPLSGEQLLADVRTEWYDIVGFSVSCDSRLDHLKREIRRVRQASKNQKVLVLVGGRAFNEHSGLLARIGADGSAANAELAPERARQLLEM